MTQPDPHDPLARQTLRMPRQIREVLTITSPWPGVSPERVREITREEADRVRAIGGAVTDAVEPIRLRLRAEQAEVGS